MDQSKIYTKEGLLEVINALPIAVAVIDQSRRVALANKMTLMFVEKPEKEVIGKLGGDAFNCIHHDDAPNGCGSGPECLRCRLRKTVMATMEERKAYSMVETSMIFKPVGLRHLRISTLPMMLTGDEVVLLTVEDLTEAKVHEQIKKEKEKLEVVLEITGAVCHELNQPLMIATGNTELLLMEMDEKSPYTPTVQGVLAEIERMGDITRKLMRISEYKTRDYLDTKILDLN